LKNKIHIELWQKSNRSCWFPVISGSMKPTLTPGMWVLVKPKKKLRMGSIFMYRHEDILITHRAIFISKDFIYEKGDNAEIIHKIKGKDILGVVVAFRNIDGKVVKLNSWHKLNGFIKAFIACISYFFKQ